MARLNEPPVSADSIETLRRKLLRQNRDLAKLNNVRALRIRELENECACMLSENIQLRGRVIDLEKQAEDGEARRIADHALAIRDQLESQLTEWGAILAGLGQPLPKRRSPYIKKSAQTPQPPPRFIFKRPSPSQRRLRDVARDINDLGSIAEHKSYSRKSMNPEQILALRSRADTVELSELGAPSTAQLIQDEPVKVDSPCASSARQPGPSPIGEMELPEALPSPESRGLHRDSSPSPQKKTRDFTPLPEKGAHQSLDHMPEKLSVSDTSIPTPTRAGIKRKFNPRGDKSDTKPMTKAADENQAPRVIAGKSLARNKSRGRTLKEEDRPEITSTRKPLSAKSANDDFASPKKAKLSMTDEVSSSKASRTRPIATHGNHERTKSKSKNPGPKTAKLAPEAERVAHVTTVANDLGTPLAEPDLLSPNSPQSAPPAEEARGDTPPPADISSRGETSRASRRSRGVVSYAEPNLRDKMRRPTKDMVDAVTGSRRSSQFEVASYDSAHSNSKRESSAGVSRGSTAPAPEPGSIPASPLAKKSQPEEAPGNTSAMQEADVSTDGSTESLGMTEVDLYEFSSSSPPGGKTKRRSTARQSKPSSRRFSAALESDDGVVPKERSTSRRRSMMV